MPPTKTQKPNRPTTLAPPPDPLRDVAGPPPRDIIPVWVLVVIFAFVELTIVWLMAPQFIKDWTAYQARHMQHKQNFEGALTYLLKLTQNDPTSPTWLGETGNAYMRLGKYDEALSYYLKAQENRENVPSDDDGGHTKVEYTDFSPTIGYLYFKKGDMANAQKYLEAGLKASKLDALANFTMGELEFNKGDYRKATDYFKVVADNPTYGSQVKDYYAKIETKLFSDIK